RQPRCLRRAAWGAWGTLGAAAADVAPLLRRAPARAAPGDGPTHVCPGSGPRALSSWPRLVLCGLRLVLQSLPRVSAGALHRPSDVSSFLYKVDSRAGPRRDESARVVREAAAAARRRAARERRARRQSGNAARPGVTVDVKRMPTPGIRTRVLSVVLCGAAVTLLRAADPPAPSLTRTTPESVGLAASALGS